MMVTFISKYSSKKRYMLNKHSILQDNGNCCMPDDVKKETEPIFNQFLIIKIRIKLGNGKELSRS